MKTSDSGLATLTAREGIRNKAYKDTKGIWTIGIGHTGKEVVEGLVWSNAQVLDAFAKDIIWAEETVNRGVIVPLTTNQFDALVSFVFNIGTTQFNSSTLRKVLNEGKYAEAAKQFDRWHIPVEVTGRRNQEKAQFLS